MPAKHDADPRLTISHLLIWSTASAVFLATYRATIPATVDGMTGGSLFVFGVHSIYAGFCLTGLWHVVRGMVRRSRRVIEPGTWVLCSSSCSVLAVMGVLVIQTWATLQPFALLVLYAAMAFGWTVPLLSRRLAARWKMLFIPMVVTYLAFLVAYAQLVLPRRGRSGLLDYLLYVRIAEAAFVVLLTTGLAWFDHRRKIRYSVFHWGGLLCLWLQFLVLPVLQWLIR